MASVAEFIQCDSRNYTAGRQGNRIRKIVVHYTGTEASAHNNLLYFSRSSAGASAHYFIDKDGTLRQLVSEGDTAWHAGHWATNLCSVGIEVVSGGADFTEAQINTLATLVADIRHYDVTGKLCPAPYVDGSKWAALHERICGGAASSGGGSGSGGSGGGPAPSGDVSELARRVINGEFGNGDVRKAALGSSYSAVQTRVNEMLGCGSSGGGSGSAGVDIDALARAVINGDYGNGEERRQRLGANYAAVQRRVNEMLS